MPSLSRAPSTPPPGLGELGSASASARASAVAALGESPRPEHAGALFTALDDRSPLVRRRAVEALAGLARAHERARGTIRRVLTRRLGADPEADLRRQIAEALAQLDAPRCGGARPGLPPRGGRPPAGAPRSDATAAPANDTTRPAAPVPANDTTRPRRPRAGRGGRRPPPLAVEALLYEGIVIERGERDCYDTYDEDYDERSYDTPPSALPASDGLAPLGPVEALVQRLTFELHDDEGERLDQRPLAARVLTPSAYGRLSGLVKRAAPEGGAPPSRPGSAAATLPELAKLARRRREGLTPVEPDWAALRAPLLEALAAAPPAGEADLEALVLALHEALVQGPATLRRALARGAWHEGWAPLACWLLSAELGSFRSRARQARGSSLALQNLREAALGRDLDEPLIARALERLWRPASQALTLLAFGGGSMRSLDYPEFRVVGHVALVELGREQEQELAALAAALTHQRQLLSELWRGPEALLRALAPELWGALGAEAQSALVGQLRRSTVAYMGLRRVPALAGVRLRRSHLVEYWQRPGPKPHESVTAGDVDPFADHDARATEGLVAALLAELHQPYADDEALQAGLKELLIEAARAAATCYAWQGLPYLQRGDLASAARLIDALLRCFDHAPRELAQALGLDPAQGLPRLRGGQAGALERRFRRFHREALRGRKAKGGEGVTYVCKPLPKDQALARGELGRDCSSSSVPFRALSPHHVYYGIFDEAGRQLPGYLTVYEAWARPQGGPARPMLCLETVNEPKGLLGGVQQDLLVLFEAIAESRGLGPGLVLVSGHGTWNYSNGLELARCRRARRGEPAWLSPADPVIWRIYQRHSDEARYYSAFGENDDGALLRHDGEAPGREPRVLLAPFDPAHDVVQPENLAEARRLAALPRREPRVTCRDEQGNPLGFISG
ncbi:MAG TPA: HEAT repeat domain-containing protein [Polyangiaceae bacterium]|nr:HEAT repeat domain-containing protein [Polyangiaceae bacterium]